jgi:hypothetical protein
MPQMGKLPQKYTHMVPKSTFNLAFSVLYDTPVKAAAHPWPEFYYSCW